MAVEDCIGIWELRSCSRNHCHCAGLAAVMTWEAVYTFAAVVGAYEMPLCNIVDAGLVEDSTLAVEVAGYLMVVRIIVVAEVGGCYMIAVEVAV